MSDTLLRLTLRLGGQEDCRAEICVEHASGAKTAAQVPDDNKIVGDALSGGQPAIGRQRDPNDVVGPTKDRRFVKEDVWGVRGVDSGRSYNNFLGLLNHACFSGAGFAAQARGL